MSVLLERVPPQNLEAEQSVLGSMLIEKEAILRATEILLPEDFYRDAHRGIYETIVAMHDKGEAVDLITVSEHLRQRGILDEVGGLAYLTTLANAVPTAANVEHYAKIVEEKSLLRQLINASTRIVTRGYEGTEDINQLLDWAEQSIFSLSQRHNQGGFSALKDVLMEAFEHIEQLYANKGGVTGVPTGYTQLDEMLSGLQPSDLIIVAARPSQGKSTLVMNIARNAAVNYRIPVAVFALEMSKEQLAVRLLCSEAGVDMQRLRTGMLRESDWKPLSVALGRLGDCQIYIDDTPGCGIMEIRARARRLKAEHNIGLVIVDYMQLVQTKGKFENRQQEISEISRSLKALARELNVPVIAASQLSRAVEQREKKRPQLSDIRESGAIEQDADVVCFIHSDPESEEKNVIELIVAKQRNGPTGSVELYFRKEVGRFENIDRRHAAADAGV
ncbi:MAG: replicative DNA helicase [Chloroflexota bacterium]